MTALRQTAMKESEKLPEDKVSFILQIMQGVNGLYNDNQLWLIGFYMSEIKAILPEDYLKM